ncbi:MAG: GNAT family N-acetyltransferase [Desulfoplanes sp.]|nr:GNAT family N-acetyltransferase [Desulfoplanes sp.]
MSIQNKYVCECTDALFAEIWSMYCATFPYEERRSLDEQQRIMRSEKYTLLAWLKDCRLLGFLGFWTYEHYCFVEHFAIHPDVRSQGYGTRLFRSWLRGIHKQILLEIEPVIDRTTQRRYLFYTALGFTKNPVEHIQQPFHAGLQPLPLELLSFPDTVSADCYQALKEALKKEIMPCFIS